MSKIDGNIMNPSPVEARLRYIQIRDDLEQAILSGFYPSGSMIPDEHELSFQYGVSRTTLRKAIKDLENRRLVRRVKGKGTFVIGKLDRIRTDYVALSFIGVPRYMESLMGAFRVFSHYNRLTVIVSYGDGELDEETAAVGQLMDQDIGGMVLTPAMVTHGEYADNSDLFENIVRQGVPIVTMERMLPEYRVSAVVFDHLKCEEMGVQWLARQGVKRVGYLGLCEGLIGIEKSKAMDRAARKFGLDWNAERDSRLSVISPNWIEDFAKKGIIDLLDSAGDIEGLVCFSDKLAALALETLKANKISHNIKYLTTHTTIGDTYLTPELLGDIKAVIALRDLHQIGRLSAEMLMQQIIDGIPDVPCVKHIRPKIVPFEQLM